MVKLIINEPWEFGTINGLNFDVTLENLGPNHILIKLDKIVEFDGKKTQYLIGRKHPEFLDIDLFNEKYQHVRMGFVLAESSAKEELMKFNFENVRGGFLSGEISSNYSS
jgi:hypothetical protein